MNAPLRTGSLTGVPAASSVTTGVDLAYLLEIVERMSLADFCEGIKSPGFPDRIGSYQYTHSGNIFFPCDPRPEEVFIKDIAVGLSRQGRFCGQTNQIMTVAEHSWLVSFQVPHQYALEAILHDAPEAFIGDKIRPLKIIPIFGTIYLKIEAGIEAAIATRYGLTSPFLGYPDIKKADEFVSGAEVAQNIGSKRINHLTDDPKSVAEGFASKMSMFFWPPELAEKMFMARVQELAAERGVALF